MRCEPANIFCVARVVCAANLYSGLYRARLLDERDRAVQLLGDGRLRRAQRARQVGALAVLRVHLCGARRIYTRVSRAGDS